MGGPLPVTSDRDPSLVGALWSNSSVFSVQSLTLLNVWCGVLLSVAGSVAVAPRALPELTKMLKQDWQGFVLWASRWLPFLRKEPGSVRLRAAGASTSTGSVVVSASGRVDDTSSVEAQLAQLRNELHALREQVEKGLSEFRERAATIEARISDVEGRLQGALAELTRRFDRAQNEQEEFDARALPLIGLGIVLTEAGGWLAGRGPLINLPVLAIVVGFSAQVVRPLAKRGLAVIAARIKDGHKRRMRMLKQFEQLSLETQVLLAFAGLSRR